MAEPIITNEMGPIYPDEIREQRALANTGTYDKATNAEVGRPVIKGLTKNIIGLPPQFHSGNVLDSDSSDIQRYVLSTMPVCRLIPVYPTAENPASSGLHLFSVSALKGRERYREILQSTDIFKDLNDEDLHDITQYLDLAYLNETNISETFSVEFGNSRFEDIANMGSSLLGEARFITGAADGGDALRIMGDTASRGLKDTKFGNFAGTLMGGFANAAAGLVDKGEAFLQKFGMSGLLSGSRIDFPQIWKNSSYNTGYSLTVRLYNADPSNDKMYRENIIIPLAKILAFVIPQSDEGALTYNSPVLCSVKCSGLWQIKAGFVSSIEVIKGGESNDISWTQRPNMIDLRISFGELYGVMTTNNKGYGDRLTLGSYLNVLEERSIDKSLSLENDYWKYKQPSAGLIGDVLQGIREKLPGKTVNSRVGENAKATSNKLKDSAEKSGAAKTLEESKQKADSVAQGAENKSAENDKSKKGWAKFKAAAKQALGKSVDDEQKKIERNSDGNTMTGKLWEAGAGSLANSVSGIGLKYTKHGIELRGTKSVSGAVDAFKKDTVGESKRLYNTLTRSIMRAPQNVTSDMANTSANAIRGTNPSTIGIAVKNGNQHIMGPQPIDIVRATISCVVDIRDSIKGIIQYGTAEEEDYDMAVTIVQMITGLPIAYTISESGTVTVTFDGVASDITGFTVSDFLVGTYNILDNLISELSIVTWMSFPTTLKNAFDSITGGAIYTLENIIKYKDAYDLSGLDEDFYKYETAKNEWKLVLEEINGGLKGELVGSKSLYDVMEAALGRLDTCYDFGIFDGLIDAFEEKRDDYLELAQGSSEESWPYIRTEVENIATLTPEDKAFVLSEIDSNIEFCSNSAEVFDSLVHDMEYIKTEIENSRRTLA